MAPQLMSVTPAAAQRIRHLLASQADGDVRGVRVGVRTAGCSGLAYTIDFARDIKAGEEVVDADGVKVVVDPKHVMYLIGTEMDYVENKLGASFVFRNPNEKARCGCGESFHV